MCNALIDKKRVILLLSITLLSSRTWADEDKSHVVQEKTDEVIVVTAPADKTKQPGSSTEITAQEMLRDGGTHFGNIMRYQPLISAPGSISGSSTGKSSWDRSGYSGYNIRGLEANRVSIDVDGVLQPIAQGRVNAVGRAGFGSYGIGRDYIDPYMYSLVNIESGATSVGNSNNALGGSVSFTSKDASYYLYPGKNHYVGYQSSYDLANRSFQNGITMAGGDDHLNGILVISRRDGQETRNNSDLLDAYPENWHSDAILAGVNWQATDTHLLHTTVDYYQKTSHSNYDTWDNTGTAVSTSDHQDSNTTRLGIVLKDTWKPVDISWMDQLITQFNYQRTRTYDDTDVDSDRYNMQTHYNTDTYNFESKLLKEYRNQTIAAGINAKWIRDESPFYSSSATSFFPDGDYSKPQADSRTYTLGGFIEDKITFVDKTGRNVYLVPGLRALYQNTKPRNLGNMSLSSLSASELEMEYNTNSDMQILPALALLYDIKPNLTAYLQYRRGAQMPNANQLYGSYLAHYNYYALVGNSDLETETSNNFELGLKGQPIAGITLSTAAFYNKYRNFIAYTRYVSQFANSANKIIYQAENRDEAYIYGTELTSKFNIGTWFEHLNGLSARLAVGYSKGASKSDYLGDKYIDLDSVAPLKLIIGVAWDDPNGVYGMAIMSTFQKGKQAEATNRQSYSNSGSAITDSSTSYYRIPGHGLIDLTAYWNLTKNIRLSGGVYNLMDQKYWDYLSNKSLYASSSQEYLELSTASGRTFQLGLNIDF